MLKPFEDHQPNIGTGVFIADSALVMGQVTLGDGANIWYGAVLRGDVGKITVGAATNVQDLTMMHITGMHGHDKPYDTTLGARVTVGHRVILHGCHVGDECLIGMGAILMDGVQVGAGCIVGAGSLLTPGTVIAPGMVALGSPAKAVRPVKPAEQAHILRSAELYMELARRHS